jgi:hypothetical protein
MLFGFQLQGAHFKYVHEKYRVRFSGKTMLGQYTYLYTRAEINRPPLMDRESQKK